MDTVHIKTEEEARALPVARLFGEKTIKRGGKNLRVPVLLESLIASSIEGDDILFFNDAGGTQMRVIHTAFGPRKMPV